MTELTGKFQPEKFQDNLRAGWYQAPRFISTNLAFLPDGCLRITPYEDSVSFPIDSWAIGIELSIIDEDDERRDPEPLLLHHAFGSCEIVTQYKSPLPHPIPLVPTSRRSHKWWIEGMDSIWRNNFYFSARLLVVQIPGSHGGALEDFLAVFYSADGNVRGQIGSDFADYAWPRRFAYITDATLLRNGSTSYTLAIPPTCRLFDIQRLMDGCYRTYEALTEPMDFWNVQPWRQVGMPLSSLRGMMWMNGRGARDECAAAIQGFKEELIASTWSPGRHIEWCLDCEEQAEMMVGGETFQSWREAAEAAEKKLSE
jgi:hypothetical protein